MKRIMNVVVLIVAAVMVPSLVMAQMKSAPPADKTQDVAALREDMEKTIGITPAQKDQMKALREEFQLKQKPLQDAVNGKRLELAQELDGDMPDRARIEKIVNEINTFQSQLIMNNAEIVLRTRALMTPEQLKKVKQVRDELRAKASAAAAGQPLEKK